MVVPQPDAVITMASSPSPSISAIQASMLRRAKAWPWASRPMWCTRAPQQPSPFGWTTSTPWRLRRRTAASLKPGLSTGWAQPDRIATRARRSPSALNVPGLSKGERAGTWAGASSIIAPRRVPRKGSLPISPLKGLASRAAPMARRKRFG
jgi:hypothetical protein